MTEPMLPYDSYSEAEKTLVLRGALRLGVTPERYRREESVGETSARLKSNWRVYEAARDAEKADAEAIKQRVVRPIRDFGGKKA